jgi:hypothetical protein
MFWALLEGTIMSFINPFKKITCPFCNKGSYPGEYLIISRVTDNKYLYPRQTVAVQTGQSSSSVRLPSQQGRWQKILSRFWLKLPNAYKGELACFECTNCGSKLPPQITRVDNNITIAIIGDVFSGKSHYITSLIYELCHLSSLSPNKSFHAIAASQEIENRYQKEFYEPLFRYKNPLDQTQQAKNVKTEPLIYELTVSEDGLVGKRFNLLLYDASGEDLAEQVQMVRHRSHILNAKAIIFLADPWSMPRFVSGLPHRLKPDPTLLSLRIPHQFLSWVERTFKEVRPELVHEHAFPLPTAIVLPKCDLIQYHPLLGQEQKYDRLWRPGSARLRNTDYDKVDALTRELLHNLEEEGILGTVRHFNKVKFFTISATGEAPNDKNKFNDIRPYRCLDPLLWILHELEMLD